MKYLACWYYGCRIDLTRLSLIEGERLGSNKSHANVTGLKISWVQLPNGVVRLETLRPRLQAVRRKY